MKWYEIHDNQIKLTRYLVRVEDFTAEQLLGVIEKPWKWERQFNEALQWHARQEAMFSRVMVS